MPVKRPFGRNGKTGRLSAKSKTTRSAKSALLIHKGANTMRFHQSTYVRVEPEFARAALKQVVYGHASDETTRATRLREGAEIVAHVKDWAGGIEAAGKWYRAQPIPALGGRTAEALVMSGEGPLVREYLDHLSQGGYA